jgi:hypothetical protein
MKRIIIIGFIFLLFSGLVNAQGLYIKVNGGYGFPAGSNTISNKESNTNSHVTLEKAVNFSFGKGNYFGGTLGYAFNKNLGAEIHAGYLLGSKNEFTERTTETNNSSFSTEILSCRMFYFVPALVVEAGFEKLNPYARLGMILGNSKIADEYSGSETYGSITDKETQLTEFEMDLGIGANAGLGVQFKASKIFALYFECNMNSLAITPKSSKITKYTENGVNRLGDLTTYQRETIFETDYSYDPTVQPPASEPDTELKVKMPFSSVGVNAGVKISF